MIMIVKTKQKGKVWGNAEVMVGTIGVGEPLSRGNYTDNDDEGNTIPYVLGVCS